jgi:hypothetical protein
MVHIHDEFGKSGFLAPNDPRYTPFQEIATKLLSSKTKTISDSQVRRICGTSKLTYQAFRESKVFAFHRDGTAVSFQSRACEAYASDNLNK